MTTHLCVSEDPVFRDLNVSYDLVATHLVVNDDMLLATSLSSVRELTTQLIINHNLIPWFRTEVTTLMKLIAKIRVTFDKVLDLQAWYMPVPNI